MPVAPDQKDVERLFKQIVSNAAIVARHGER
jgi:hypothetical protein